MAAQGQNKGFHVLDEFVCEAIHDPSIPLANPVHQGRNEGLSVIEELLFEAGKGPASEDGENPGHRQTPGPTALNDAIKSEVQRLAVIIASSDDPIGAVTLLQKLLVAELSGIEKTAAAALEISRAAGS
jgi:hypothetical protein